MDALLYSTCLELTLCLEKGLNVFCICVLIVVHVCFAGPSPVCPPCDNEQSIDAVLEHMCASEFGEDTCDIYVIMCCQEWFILF